MARVVITASADADAAAVIDDLTAKAGARVAARYDADLTRSIGAWSDFPKAARRAANWSQQFALASCFRMLSFTATSKPMTPCLFSAFYTVAAKSPAACCGNPRPSHDLRLRVYDRQPERRGADEAVERGRSRKDFSRVRARCPHLDLQKRIDNADWFYVSMNYLGDLPESEIQRINRAAKNERKTGKWLAVKRKRSFSR